MAKFSIDLIDHCMYVVGMKTHPASNPTGNEHERDIDTSKHRKRSPHPGGTV
jgi:hypothetical protein